MKNPPQAFSAGLNSITALATLVGFLALSPAPTPDQQTQEPPIRLAKPLQHEITVQLKSVHEFLTIVHDKIRAGGPSFVRRRTSSTGTSSSSPSR